MTAMFRSACAVFVLLAACGPAAAGGPLGDLATAWRGTFVWDGGTEPMFYEGNFLEAGEIGSDGWTVLAGVARSYVPGEMVPTEVTWEAFVDQDGRMELYERLVDPADAIHYDTDGYYIGQITPDGCHITARWMSTAGGGEPEGQGNLALAAIDRPGCRRGGN